MINYLEGEDQNYYRGNVFGALSEMMLKRGDHTEAVRYAEMAVDTLRKDPFSKSYVQLDLARAERALGEQAESLHLVELV